MDKEEILMCEIRGLYVEFWDDCDIDYERGIDGEYFASWAKEEIEKKYGDLFFDDYNIESYATSYCESKEAQAQSLEEDYI